MCLTQPCEEENSLPNVKKEKPIYYLSYMLCTAQSKKLTIEKEAYAIHYTLQKLNYYLQIGRFIIKTDHKCLKYLLESPMQKQKSQLWALGMAGYNCNIEYIAGTKNLCANLLSRKPNGEHHKIETQPFEFDINAITRCLPY